MNEGAKLNQTRSASYFSWLVFVNFLINRFTCKTMKDKANEVVFKYLTTSPENIHSAVRGGKEKQQIITFEKI